MALSKIINPIFKSAVNYVKKNPKTTALVGAGVLAAGCGIASASKKSKKEQVEAMNWFYLTNPFLNPLGFYQHTINPGNVKPNQFDSPIVKHVIDKNNENLEKYYKEHPEKRVQDFYKDGGRGIIA